MDTIIAGVKKYQQQVFPGQQGLFQRLASGQQPRALFITCSDSRIDPNLITQTEPGHLFVLRNPGNIVPPYGTSGGGEEAAIEYAMAGLNVPHVIICGHHRCGAMTELVECRHVADLPATTAWLRHAEPVRKSLAIKELESSSDPVSQAVESNVLVQIGNLKTYPQVAERLEQDLLTVHGWIYDCMTGAIQTYDFMRREFVPLVRESLDSSP